MKKKKIIIGIVLVLVIVVIAIILINILGKKDNNENIEVTYEIAEKEYKYFILRSNGKYGVIDNEGNIVIEPKYESIVIPNPKKSVFICSNGDEKNIVMDNNANELFNIYDNVEPININGITSSLPYEKDVLKYRVNDEYGLMDFEGKRISKAIYEDIDGLKYKEGELVAKYEGKYGVINIKGEKIVDFEYDNIEGDKYYTELNGYKNSGYIVCNTTEEGYRYGYVSNKGKKITDVEYNDMQRVIDIEDSDDIYLIASSNGQYGLLENNEKLIDFKYQGIEYNKLNNLLKINKSTKYGVYTLEGEEIVPIEYKTLQFSGVYIYAKNGDDVRYFTSKGQEVTTGFTSLQPIQNGKYYLSVDENGLYGIVDSSINTLVENKYVYIDYLFGDYFSAYRNGSGLGIINQNGKVIIDYKYTILNKIGETNLIKAEDMQNNLIEIYNEQLEKITQLNDSELEIRDSYMKLENENASVYMDMKGNIITEEQALAVSDEAPDTIGNYIKDYFGYSQVFYREKTNEDVGE